MYSINELSGVELRDDIEKLVLIRHRLKWSRVDAAKNMGVALRALRSWEERKRAPSGKNITQLQRFIRKHEGR